MPFADGLADSLEHLCYGMIFSVIYEFSVMTDKLFPQFVSSNLMFSLEKW